MFAAALIGAIVLVVAPTACADHPPPRDADREVAPTALVRAAGAGDLAAVRRLLAGGADVDARDASGPTAVIAAAMNEHVDVVAALIDAGADVDLQETDRNNALLLAGENGNVALLREVLRARPDLRATNRFEVQH